MLETLQQRAMGFPSEYIFLVNKYEMLSEVYKNEFVMNWRFRNFFLFTFK